MEGRSRATRMRVVNPGADRLGPATGPGSKMAVARSDSLQLVESRTVNPALQNLGPHRKKALKSKPLESPEHTEPQTSLSTNSCTSSLDQMLISEEEDHIEGRQVWPGPSLCGG